MILKSYIVEQNISSLDNYHCVLLYGENNGIKDDLKDKIKVRNPGAEIINLFQEELIKDRSLLIKNLENSSLFSASKIFFLHEITDKVIDQLIDLKLLLNKDNKLFIFANILDKRSKIRSLFEKDKTSATVACYQDSERTLSIYINNLLKGYKGLTQEITNLIIYNSSQDRKKIKNEVSKIINYFDNKIINKNHVEELLNIKYDNNFEHLRDATLNGDKNKTNKLISEIEFLQEDNFYYLNNMTQRIAKLIQLKNLNNDLNDIEETFEKIKPKIFWKDKPIFTQQLKKWNEKKLQIALNDIADIEILMKKNSSIRKDILIKNLIINLCNKAATF